MVVTDSKHRYKSEGRLVKCNQHPGIITIKLDQISVGFPSYKAALTFKTSNYNKNRHPHSFIIATVNEIKDGV